MNKEMMNKEEKINLESLFKGKIIESLKHGPGARVTLITEDGYKLVLEPNFDVQYVKP